MELDCKRLEWNTLCCQSNEQKRRCFMFFNNSVCLLWQVARFQSVQGQATSLDPKPRLKRGAISLSDSGTRPGLSSYPPAHIQIHKYANTQIHKYTIYLTLPLLTLHRRTSNYGSSSSLISPVLRFAQRWDLVCRPLCATINGMEWSPGQALWLLCSLLEPTSHDTHTRRSKQHCIASLEVKQLSMKWSGCEILVMPLKSTTQYAEAVYICGLQGRKELPHAPRIPQLKAAANGMKWSGRETLDTLLISLQMLGYFCALQRFQWRNTNTQTQVRKYKNANPDAQMQTSACIARYICGQL